MKLTVITGYYFPEQTADVHLNYDLVSGLSEKFDLTLITQFPIRNVPKSRQLEYVSRCDERVSNTLRILRIGKPATFKKSIAQRGAFLVMQSLKMFRTAKKTETDVFLITSTPPFLGYVAAMLAKRKPVIYLVRDMFPDSLVHTKKLDENNFVIKILRIFEKKVYAKSSHLIAISDDIKKTLVSKGICENKISVIYDWIDEKLCCPVEKEDNPLFDEFGLDRGKFYVCYAGNIGPLQNVDIIVDVAKQLEDECPNLRFLIIGDGSCDSELDFYIRNKNATTVLRFPMQPLERVPYVYSLGDACLVTLKHDITKYALPSKTWSVMATGRAVICSFDRYSALATIIEDNNCGICTEPEDIGALAEAIRKLYYEAGTAKEMGISGRRYIENNLTKESALSKYVELLKHWQK